MEAEHRRIVFVDVDTQRDFMEPAGTLYLEGASEIVANLRRLTDFARRHGIPIIATADAHSSDDREFDTFPPHCVKGSRGQGRIDATAVPEAELIPAEQQDRAAVEKLQRTGAVIVEKTTYDPFTNPNMQELVESLGQAEYVVYGVAIDYCVKKAVEGLLHARKPVTIVVDAVRAVDPAEGQRVLDELVSQGARLATTDELLAQLRPKRR